MRSSGLPTPLTLAWSRDSDQMIYVQHRMREVGRDFWTWLNEGADVYVCGDALRMAEDVEAALVDIIASMAAAHRPSGKVPRRAEDQGPVPDRRLLERAGCADLPLRGLARWRSRPYAPQLIRIGAWHSSFHR